MNRLVPVLLSSLVLATGATLSPADEGMWQPRQLPRLGERLSAMGLEIDPARMADLTGHPMNAVISLGGCTASFVSPQGLVITNHHCALRSIQYNSTEEKNLLEHGFLARNRSEELRAGPGSRVLVTVEVENVTGKVLDGLTDALSGLKRYEAIEDRRKKMVAECEKEDGYRCSVRSFYGGLEYDLFKALEIRDVRLVYAPARGIGDYGGDIDNWLWPRHTGDYSFFRAYVGPDGKPADPDEKNVPYRPSHYLTVATDGVAEGDLVLVAGYPGRTGRYRLADEVESRFVWYYPTRKRLLEELLAIIEAETADHPDDAIKYAGYVAGLNNSIKNYQGMLEGFAKGGMLERKREEERALRAWAERDGEKRARYAKAMDTLQSLVAEQLATRERDLFYGMVRRDPLFSSARTLYRLSREREKPDPERKPGYQERDLQRIRERLTRLQRTFAPRVGRALWRQAILRYAEIPDNQRVPEFDSWFGIGKGGVDESALDEKLGRMYSETKLESLDERLRWLDAKPESFEKSEDPFLQLAVRLYPSDLELEKQDEEISGRFSVLRPRYLEGLIEYRSGRGEPIYPDANGTLRVTYGTVRGYSPKDGVWFTPFTTLEGIVEKETGEPPFRSPHALLEAIEEKRYGRYAAESLGSVPVNFLSDVDTTGGNSGSPTLNGRGELVGLLFDGVFESIIADWDFDPKRTRSIHVDIRYALWVMEQVDGADRLLREMGIGAPSSKE